MIENYSSKIISDLRGLTLSGTATADQAIVEGLYLSWDTEEGDVSISFNSESDTLLSLKTEVYQAPRWFSLNLALGDCQLKSGDILGLLFDGQSSPASNFHIFVRSAHEGAFEDTPLDTALRIPDRRGAGSLLHTVQPHSALTGSTKFHTLVIPLPPQDFSVTIRDLRLFVLPEGYVPSTTIEGSIAELAQGIDPQTQQAFTEA